MANTISNYADILQSALDTAMIAKATSGWMEANAGQVIYTGGKTVKIPKLSTQGLANYSRENGYVGGSATFSYESRTLTQDRGRKFSIDVMDTDETNFQLTVTNVLADFQNNHVVPEVDAYRYSKLFADIKTANADNVSYGRAISLKNLLADINGIQDIVGDMPLVISMNTLTYADICSDSSISRHLDVANFTKGDLTFAVKTIDGVPIIPVPSARMKTEYTFLDGTTNSGGNNQTAGGFAAKSNAKTINWIITPKNAPIAVSKTDKVRIFSSDIYQNANSNVVDYRKVHDIWLADEKAKLCKVAVKESNS